MNEAADLAGAVELTETAEGCRLPVQAQPGGKRNGISGVHDGQLKLSVTQVAEKGKANAALAKLLAELLGLPKRDVELLSGKTSRKKVFLFRNCRAADIRARIRRHLGDV